MFWELSKQLLRIVKLQHIISLKAIIETFTILDMSLIAESINRMKCFLPESRDGKFGVLRFPVSREIYVGIPGRMLKPLKFFHIKGFSGTDIYHSDVKMRACSVEKIFYSLKIFFQNFQKFFRPNAR